MKLYEIPIEAEQIERELSENFGELTPEIEARISEFMRQGKDKVEAAAMVVRSIQAEAEICYAEAKRLAERAGGLDRAADRLKLVMLGVVDSAFGGKLKTAKFTMYGQTSAAHTSFRAKDGTDMFVLSLENSWCVRTPQPELDKVALASAYKEGREIPACIEVSETPGKRSLRIK